MKMETRKVKRYILPFYFDGAPNPSVHIELEIRPVNFRLGEDISHLNLCRLYQDSQYNPIQEQIEKIDSAGYITIEQAEQICKDFNCIPVKDDFDFYNVQDLREIKDFLSAEWIKGFNSYQENS